MEVQLQTAPGNDLCAGYLRSAAGDRSRFFFEEDSDSACGLREKRLTIKAGSNLTIDKSIIQSREKVPRRDTRPVKALYRSRKETSNFITL